MVKYDPRHEKTNALHICENKDAADQRLYFRYFDNTIPRLL